MRFFILILDKLDSVLERLEVFILSISIIAMAINTIANVIGRYAFNHGLYFSEEINQYLMVVITFIGLSYVTRKGRHIRMSAIYDVLDDKLQKYLMLLITLSTAIVMFILAYYSVEYLIKLAGRGKVTPSLRLPVYLMLICLPIGFIITGIQFVLAFAQNLRYSHIYVSYSCIDTYEAVDLEMTSASPDSQNDAHRPKTFTGGTEATNKENDKWQ
jgi:TRAP-type C4-dicarboxylate transport system permease small subunit